MPLVDAIKHPLWLNIAPGQGKEGVGEVRERDDREEDREGEREVVRGGGREISSFHIPCKVSVFLARSIYYMVCNLLIGLSIRRSRCTAGVP